MNEFENLGRLYVLCGGAKEDFCLEGSRLAKFMHKLSRDIDEGYFLAWLIAHADSCTITADGDLNVRFEDREATERVTKYTVSPDGMRCVIRTENIIDFNDDYIEVEIFTEPDVGDTEFHDVYKQLLDSFADVLSSLQEELMKEGYTDETELHNNKGAADSECERTAEKARTTCKRNRGCRTCGKGRKD